MTRTTVTRRAASIVALALLCHPAPVTADEGGDDGGGATVGADERKLLKVAASVYGATPEETALATGVTEVLIAILSGRGTYEIVGSSVLREKLGLGSGGALACARDSICLGNAAATLGIKKLFVGKLGATGEGITLNLNIVDVTTFKVDRSSIVESAGIEDLFGKLPGVVELLLRAKRPANLFINVNVPAAKVTLDAGAPLTGPRAAFTDISPGEHKVRVVHKGYGTVVRRLTISAGEDKELDVRLLKVGVSKRGPIYARWWFWTSVGVIVAGSATAVVLYYTVADRIPRDVPVFPLD